MFLAKSILLESFKTLSRIDGGNTAQGLTKKVSYLRHLIALDQFCKKFGCSYLDATETQQKKDFIRCVADVVQVIPNKELYTPNFIELKRLNDCGVQSNFFGGGPVLRSHSTLDILNYPTYGTVFLSVQNQRISIHHDAYDNLSRCLAEGDARIKVALCLWLARNYNGFTSSTSLHHELKSYLLTAYSSNLVEAIIPDAPALEDFIMGLPSVLNDLATEFIEEDFMNSSQINENEMVSLQLISYGAPGTGKSHKIEETTRKLPKEDVVRTTFHPESDYSTFVGSYKPKMYREPRTMMKGEKIEKITQGDAELLFKARVSYAFVPQAFARAYVQAWKRMAESEDGAVRPVMLVIEEINRGDCAKAFGDLFQLLDRRGEDDDRDETKKAGFSEYPVLADSDFADYIRGELSSVKAAIEAMGYDSVVADDKLELMLPPNMYIWATMNTSDQSLFQMDSAFKRRWNWEYVPIQQGRNTLTKNPLGWAVVVGEGDQQRDYDWWSFVEKINDVIDTLTSSEDKKLGYFFVKPKGKTIDQKLLVNKVFFYLWNDVFRDMVGDPALQIQINGKSHDLKFHDFFNSNDGTINVDTIKAFFEKLGVQSQKTNQQNASEPQPMPTVISPSVSAAPSETPVSDAPAANG